MNHKGHYYYKKTKTFSKFVEYETLAQWYYENQRKLTAKIKSLPNNAVFTSDYHFRITI